MPLAPKKKEVKKEIKKKPMVKGKKKMQTSDGFMQ